VHRLGRRACATTKFLLGPLLVEWNGSSTIITKRLIPLDAWASRDQAHTLLDEILYVWFGGSPD
jgi:hypothetical protein